MQPVKILIVPLLCAIVIANTPTAHAITNTQSFDLERSSNQSLFITNASSTLQLHNSFTFESWLKLESQPTSGQNYSIFTQWNTASPGLVFTYTNVAGTLKLRLEVRNAANTSSTEKTVTYDLGINVWRHIALSYNAAAGTAEIFIDGDSIGTMTGLPLGLHNSTADVVIGHDGNYGSGSSWDGLMDDIRIWSTTKSASDINSNKFTTLTGTESGLGAYWTLDNNYLDTTSNANTLTPRNTPNFSEEPPHQLSCNMDSPSTGFHFTVSCTLVSFF